MSEKKFYEDHRFWVGAGAYYGLSWISNFYPAFIIGLFACQLSNSSTEGGPEFVGLMWMIGAWVVFSVLILCEKYLVLAIIYIFFAWPFIHQVMMYFKHLNSGIGGTNECFPLPTIDWWLFW